MELESYSNHLWCFVAVVVHFGFTLCEGLEGENFLSLHPVSLQRCCICNDMPFPPHLILGEK